MPITGRKQRSIRRWLCGCGIAALALTACLPAAPTTDPAADQIDDPPAEAGDIGEAPAPELPNLGPAPELGNEVWLNTADPLRLADLRGSVVLLDMWTFG